MLFLHFLHELAWLKIAFPIYSDQLVLDGTWHFIYINKFKHIKWTKNNNHINQPTLLWTFHVLILWMFLQHFIGRKNNCFSIAIKYAYKSLNRERIDRKLKWQTLVAVSSNKLSQYMIVATLDAAMTFILCFCITCSPVLLMHQHYLETWYSLTV